MSMWCNTDVKQVKTFRESDQEPEFFLLRGPKRPKNWALEAHIVHISENSFNERVKQDWCESRSNFFNKIVENLNLDSFDSFEIWHKQPSLGVSHSYYETTGTHLMVIFYVAGCSVFLSSLLSSTNGYVELTWVTDSAAIFATGPDASYIFRKKVSKQIHLHHLYPKFRFQIYETRTWSTLFP